MLTWYNENNNIFYHSYQLASIGLSTLIIAKSCTDHHYFEVSGKAVRGRVQLNLILCADDYVVFI